LQFHDSLFPELEQFMETTCYQMVTKLGAVHQFICFQVRWCHSHELWCMF